jgi:bifunctional oligoribonuclease and PAP phosphatase NrnA
MAKAERSSIISALQSYKRIMIGTHSRPDGDAVGSVLALALVLCEDPLLEVTACVDQLPPALAFLPGADKLIFWEAVSEDYRPDVFVALDCGSASRLGDGYPYFVSASVRINIDHHISNDYYGDYNLVDPHAAATGEIIYFLLQEMGTAVNLATAACLYAAIATDTGSFRFTNTTATTHRIAAELHETGLDCFGLSQQLFDTRTPQEVQLLAAVLGTFELAHEGRVALLTIRQSMLDDHDILDAEAENYAGYARSVQGVQVAVLLREQKDVVRVSLRARDATDVNAIAQRFGGGGHQKASGAVVRGSLECVKERVLQTVVNSLAGRETDGS